MEHSSHYLRWYEQDPDLAKLVRAIEAMNPSYQELFCRVIIRLYENVRDQEKESNRLVELGVENVTALMKSKSKRRWYDQDPLLHKAFNCLKFLPENKEKAFVQRINVCVYYVNLYEKACEHFGQPILMDQVISLVQQIIRRGADVAPECLEAFGLWDPAFVADSKAAKKGKKKKEKTPPPDINFYITESQDKSMRMQRHRT